MILGRFAYLLNLLIAVVLAGCSQSPANSYSSAQDNLKREKQKFDDVYAVLGPKVEPDAREKAAIIVVKELTGLDVKETSKEGGAAVNVSRDLRANLSDGKPIKDFTQKSLAAFDGLKLNQSQQESIKEVMAKMLVSDSKEAFRWEEVVLEVLEKTPEAKPLMDQMVEVGKAYSRMADARTAAGISGTADEVREYFWFQEARWNRERAMQQDLKR